MRSYTDSPFFSTSFVVIHYEEIRSTPRTARRVYLPEVIGNYIEYYF
jgi:hypothetical protein